MAQPVVGILMGSRSDLPVMQEAMDLLERFEVPFEAMVMSAHRNPDGMLAYARGCEGRGIRALIAGAGMAAHLPGMLAAVTTLPVYGVPIQSKALGGVDALYSIVQMPRGVPVATFAIGGSGATNAALHLIQSMALHDLRLRSLLLEYRAERSAQGTEHLHG